MSVGSCVQKKTPIPLDRMSFTVWVIWSRNALEALENSRCASSKKKTSLGFSTSPSSGSVSNSSASSHIRNVEIGRASCRERVEMRGGEEEDTGQGKKRKRS